MPVNPTFSESDLTNNQRRFIGQFNTIYDLLHTNYEQEAHIGDTCYIVEEQSYYVYDGQGFNALIEYLENNDITPTEYIGTESHNENYESHRIERLIEDSYDISQSFIRFDENTHSFVYTPSDMGEQIPYIPSQLELEDYDVYFRRKNPNCKNLYPIAIGKLANRFLVMINEGLSELSIE